MIEKWWKELEKKYPHIRLDEYIIMPNHFHGIIEIREYVGIVGADLRVCPDPERESVGADLHVCPDSAHDEYANWIQGEHIGSPLQEPNDPTGSPLQKPTISHMIQWFKTMTTNKCIRGVKSGIFPSFEKHLWQRNYWEHIIRNEKSLTQIREYIKSNPSSWSEDSLFTKDI
jgi:putative transposase